MASGELLFAFGPEHAEFPAANWATRELVGQTTGHNMHYILAFDPTTDESVYFTSVLPRNYAGGGITVTLLYTTSVASNTVRWGAAFEAIPAGTALGSDSFATAKTVGAGGSSPDANDVETTSFSFTTAEADSVAVGEAFRLQIYRDADGTSGTDDNTGDARLISVKGTET